MTSRLQRARAALILTTILSPCITVFAARAADDGTQVAQAAPAPSAATSIEIPEITITAQKRSESLSKAALSVSAFDGAALQEQGLKSFADIARVTPGLNLSVPATGFTGDPQITIRGIVATAGAATTGIYIDDTPISVRPDLTASNPFPKIFDLDRVEVLRGPQGVLFGAGSEGGTVRFVTPTPSLTEYSGMGRAEGAFTDGGAPSYEVGGAFGGPLVDNKVGIRVSAWHREDGGYINRVNQYSGDSADRNSNQELSDVARIAVKFQPTDQLSITPAIYYQDTFRKDLDLYAESTQAGLPLSRFVSGANFQQPRDDKFTLASITGDYEFEDFSIKLITSNFHRNANSYVDATSYDLSQFVPTPTSLTGGVFLPTDPNYMTRALFTTGQKNWTSELRFTSNTGPSDRLSWVFGAYYTHNHQTEINDYREPLDEVFAYGPALAAYIQGQQAANPGFTCVDVESCLGVPLTNNQSYFGDFQSNETELTGFLNVGYKIFDQVKLELGVRYARSTYDFYEIQDGPDNGGRTEDFATRTETPVSPRVSLSYQVDPSTLVYATAAKGYRIGGGNIGIPALGCAADLQNLGIANAPQTYSSDRVWSYEAGTKARMFSNTVEIDASAFIIDWSNIQSNVFLPICGYNFTGNLGKARSQGFDIQGQWRIGGGWVLAGNVGLTDARYTTTTYAGSGVVLAKHGDPLPTPEWQAVASVEYNFAVAEHDSFVRAEYDFTGPYYRTGSADISAYDPSTRSQPAVHYLTMRAGTTISDIDIAAFANNILNSHQSLYRYHDTTATPLYRDIAQRPLTIGLTSTYHF
jgi:iron complex outermembrane receptor protein